MCRASGADKENVGAQPQPAEKQAAAAQQQPLGGRGGRRKKARALLPAKPLSAAMLRELGELGEEEPPLRGRGGGAEGQQPKRARRQTQFFRL